MKIHCDAVTMASTGQAAEALESRRAKGNLPLGYYCFDMVRIAYHKEYINRNFKEIQEISGISKKEFIKLKGMVAEKLVRLPESVPKQIQSQTITDLRNNEVVIKASIASKLAEYIYTKVDPESLDIKLEFIDETDFRVETNIESGFNLDKITTHKIVERGLLGISGINQRIAQMETFNSLVGFSSDDVNLLGQRMIFLLKKLSPEKQSEKFHKVLSAKGLPNFAQAATEGRIDLIKLLELRELRECVDFRNWLWSQDEINTKELNERLKSFSQKFHDFFKTDTGKTISWLASTTIGFIPYMGNIIGSGLGFYDKFLAKEVLPNQGAITFINNRLPSIYDEPKEKNLKKTEY